MMSAPARKAAVLGHVSGGTDAQTQGRARGAPGAEQGDVSLDTDSCTFGEQCPRTSVECPRDFRKMFETNPPAVLRGWKQDLESITRPRAPPRVTSQPPRVWAGDVSPRPLGGEVGLGRLGAHGWGQDLAESGLRPGAEPAGTCLLAATDRPARWWLSEGVPGFRVLSRLPPGLWSNHLLS